MKTRIIKIGNSQGIRIPKAILEQAGLGEEVDLRVEDRQIVLSRGRRPREGWEVRFADLAVRGDDALNDGDLPSSIAWDEREWEWSTKSRALAWLPPTSSTDPRAAARPD